MGTRLSWLEIIIVTIGLRYALLDPSGDSKRVLKCNLYGGR